MSKDERAYGRAWLIALPVSPDDLTTRAVNALRDAVLVIAGPGGATRWLEPYAIDTEWAYAVPGIVDRVLKLLARGHEVALLAGPGDDAWEPLLARIDDAGFEILTPPAAVTPVAALAGLAWQTDGCEDLGALPRGAKRRHDAFAAVAATPRPVAFAVGSDELAEVIETARQTLGDRPARLVFANGRQVRGTLAELASQVWPGKRTEVRVVVAGHGAVAGEAVDLSVWTARAHELLAEGASAAATAKRLAAESGLPRAEAYRLATEAAAEAPQAAREVSFSFVGHPDIRATHDKTVEFKRGDDCSVRETCVVGVGADWDPAQLKMLRGVVEVEIQVDELRATLATRVNRRFDARDRLVLRKSRHAGPETFGTDATDGADTLPRELVERLQRTDARGRVTLRARH